MDGVHPTDGSDRRPWPVRAHGLARRAVVGALVALLGAAGAGVAARPARAATLNRAAVVVEVDGVIHTAKITFSTDTVSGLDALRSAGFDPTVRVFGGNGGAVCALRVGSETIGCPADGSCLTCDAHSDYWAYFRAPAGATSYTYSVAGAGTTQVHDGDVEAWAWGTGSPPSPFVSFRDVWGPDPPPTTNRPPATPPTTARRPPPATVPPAVGPLASVPTIGSTTVPTSAATPPRASTTTTKPSAVRAPRSGSPTTGASSTSEPLTGREGARRVATAPVVARGGGGSPSGLIGFAALLAALLTAIFVARRRRSARLELPT